MFKTRALLALMFCLTACGGGSGGVVSADGSPATKANTEPSTVTISGVVTFALVPHFSDTSGLNYAQTRAAPARHVQVQLLAGTGRVLDTGTTTAAGAYSLEAATNTPVRIRVLARMQRSGSPSWSFSVTDNTRGNALYALDGQLVSSGTKDSVRNLHAASGWDGQAYATTRAAAPFAILDTLHQAIDRILAVSPAVNFPPLQVRWSRKNVAVDGELENGQIGTSFYASSNGASFIYLLGQADNDTDEYDRSVITHEFAHYLEHRLSRLDSIGGSHFAQDKLDMRVAYSEGWGNAFVGIAAADPLYQDSYGNNQKLEFSFSVAQNNSGTQGWYSERSIQTIIYNLYDSTVGFGSIFNTLISEGYRQFDGAISIYTFATRLKAQAGVNDTVVNALLSQEQIFGEGSYGANETNNGTSTLALPVYHSLTLGSTTQVCSGELWGEYNGLGVRRFVRLHLVNGGRYQITAERSGGLQPSDPNFILWQRGEWLHTAETTDPNREELVQTLPAGHYWLEVYEYTNADDKAATGGQACFTLSLSAAP